MSPLSIPDLHQMPVSSREEIAERVALQELFDALSWGASLFLGNCRRLNNVFDGTPEVFVTKYFPNPNRVPDTLAGIVDPGPERGRDERHCFCRLARAMQAIPESKAPFSDAARSFLDAIAAEARLLLDHAPCVELIDYWDAVRSLMSIVFQQEYPVMPPEEYRKLIRDKGLELAIARKKLYNRYCLPTPSVTLETLNSKFDTTSQTIISTLGGKIDYTRIFVSEKLDGRTLNDDAVKRAMVDRGIETFDKFPHDDPQQHWRKIYSEYVGVAGAYTSFGSYRRQIKRKLAQRDISRPK